MFNDSWYNIWAMGFLMYLENAAQDDSRSGVRRSLRRYEESRLRYTQNQEGCNEKKNLKSMTKQDKIKHKVKRKYRKIWILGQFEVGILKARRELGHDRGNSFNHGENSTTCCELSLTGNYLGFLHKRRNNDIAGNNV
jgi:hypothetical protein